MIVQEAYPLSAGFVAPRFNPQVYRLAGPTRLARLTDRQLTAVACRLYARAARLPIGPAWDRTYRALSRYWTGRNYRNR